MSEFSFITYRRIALFLPDTVYFSVKSLVLAGVFLPSSIDEVEVAFQAI